MEDDDRFKHLASDPRFRSLRKQQRKVKIDERFQSMFTDERFTLQYKRDKRGRVIDKSTGDDLKKYYDVDDEHDDDAIETTTNQEEKKLARRQRDSVKRSDKDEQPESGQNEEDADDESSEVSSSSSDEPESSDEEPEPYLDPDWNDLDKDAPRAEQATHRIAICNVDWDRLSATDLFVVVNSFHTPKSLRIYLSDFGRERLKEEELHGPTEIVGLSSIKEEEKEDDEENEDEDVKDDSYTSDDEASDHDDQSNGKRGRRRHRQHRDAEHVLAINHYEDEEDIDNIPVEVAKRIRKYQISRLKYYYAVVEFDTPEDANHVYNELDGMEYEGSSSALDLRFIPEDMTFDNEQLHSECNSMPDLVSYQAPQFITTALQQSKVRLTWDETDPKRLGKLRKSYTQEELEKDDLDAYLASETDSDSASSQHTDSDEDVSENNGQNSRIAKYRKLLEDVEAEQRKRDKVGVEIEWDDGLNGQESHSEKNQSFIINALSSDDETSGYNKGDHDDESQSSSADDSDHDCCSDSHQQEQGAEIIDDPLESDDDSSKRKKKRYRNKRTRKGEEPADPILDLMVMETNEGETERKHFNYRRITGEEKSKKDKRKKKNKYGKTSDAAENENFAFNPDDERFSAVYESHLYNIDPSDRRFKRTAAYEELAKRKRQRRGIS